jgi:hypothetical protein
MISKLEVNYLNIEKYKNHDGIGLIFIGVPKNYDEFIYICESYSCPPIITRGILDDLIKTGYRVTTVRNQLNFIKLRKELSEVNIEVYLCDPLLNLGGQRKLIDYSGYVKNVIMDGKDLNRIIENHNSDKYKYEKFDINFYKDIYNQAQHLFSIYGRTLHENWR